MTIAISILHDTLNERRRVKRKPVPPAFPLVSGSASAAVCTPAKSQPTCRVTFESASACTADFEKDRGRDEGMEVEEMEEKKTTVVSFPSSSTSSSSSISFPSTSTSPPSSPSPTHALLRPRQRQRITASFSSPSPSENLPSRKRPGTTCSSGERKKARKAVPSCSSVSGAENKGKEDERKSVAGKKGKTKKVGELRVQIMTYRCLLSLSPRRGIVERESDKDGDDDVSMSDSNSGASNLDLEGMEVMGLPEETTEDRRRRTMEMQDRLLHARLRSFLVHCGVDVGGLERDVALSSLSGSSSTNPVDEGVEGNVEARSSVPPSLSPLSSHSQNAMEVDMDLQFPESDLRSASSSTSSCEAVDPSSIPLPPSPTGSPTTPTKPEPKPHHVVASLLIRHAGRARRRVSSEETERRRASPLRRFWIEG